MNYKKIQKDNYTLHLIKTDRFKTVKVSLRLSKAYNKEESVYLKLLEKVLPINGTKKYKDINEITKALESLYNARIGYNFFVTAENMCFSTTLNIINPKYTEEKMYTETFNLFKDILTKPLLKDNKFKYFDNEKENLITNIKNAKDSLNAYSSLRFNEEFYKGTVYSEDNLKNIKLFENITNEKLLEVYNGLFNSFKIDVLVLGDYNEEEITLNVDNLLKDFTSKDNTEKDLYIKIKSKEEIKKESFNSSQSSLRIGLTLDNITEEERNSALLLYNTILGSMNNSVLFVNVREKNSLCYHVGSTINKFTDTLVIDAGISKENFEKTVSIIKDCLEMMKDVSVVKRLMKNAKKTLDISFNDFYENSTKIMNYYHINEFSYMPSIEERRTMVNNVTEEDVVSIANRISVGLIYLLEGSANEEN